MSLGHDTPKCRWEANNLFTTKFSYKALAALGQLGLEFNWNLIWTLKDLEFKHIHRSGNGVADGLARLAYGAPVGAWIFREPPAEVATALLKDLHDLA
ncbi:hypothetical protein V6N12_033904 [Hibiscus sabdariffa]|uniref:RNase H type-1 domain-containing protein n=1 Tax=Hibiscus sabdariffa TaxID=183260 RepID=A0ABR1ZGQ6_9ROSI